MTQSDRQIEGQLSEHPLAELIREIKNTELSGALRLSLGRAQVVVYFGAGDLVFAASNLRAHRLREVLKRNDIANQKLQQYQPTISDEELAEGLIKSGGITPAFLQKARLTQASDVLRVALLWTDGYWSFDRRVRVANDLRVTINVDRLLRECAHHLPMSFVRSRFNNLDSGFSVLDDIDLINLSPAEEFTLSRARAAGDGIRLADLSTNGLAEEESLRSVYALSLSGILYSPHWRTAISANGPVKPKKRSAPPAAKEAPPAVEAGTTEAELEALFTRLTAAKNHYDVLGVPKGSSTAQIKDAYHALARRFHPDRFHQSNSKLRARIESAFARMAQAYEVLSDTKQRDDYDQAGTTRRTRKSTTGPKAPRDVNVNDRNPPGDSRAETCFRMGTEAFERNQIDQAIRLLAEAAMLEPREARYRAHYGNALMRLRGSRRTAETELQAALAIEPDNASFRVMLAELYQQLGLRRRAETEVARALAVDPANHAARALLSDLKSK
ncbi:MAG TPA: DnaJ domain-containing protein [Pyrinomonadaceae bacterium]|nr:DnaJ domain-containing protein [Pyrinomonadaceae bacterium]